MICLRMEKTNTAKTPPGDFKVTTPENSLLSQQAVTSKGIPVPYTTYCWTLTLILNWTCFVVINPPFQCTAPSTWLANSMCGFQYVTSQFYVWISVRGLLTNLRKMLAAKFFRSSMRWRSRSSLVTKPYGVQTKELLQEKDELGQILSPVKICINYTLLHTCTTFYGP